MKRILLIAGLFTAGAAHADGIHRVPLPASVHFPIAAAVEVPPGHAMIYLSGVGASVSNSSAPPHSLAAYGNMETQTASALAVIAKTLSGMGLTMGDVVQMHAYLVADKSSGALDFDGFMRGYTRFFGTTAQPNLPARSAMQVAALVNPGWLVEIEVTAARP